MYAKLSEEFGIKRIGVLSKKCFDHYQPRCQSLVECPEFTIYDFSNETTFTSIYTFGYDQMGKTKSFDDIGKFLDYIINPKDDDKVKKDPKKKEHEINKSKLDSFIISILLACHIGNEWDTVIKKRFLANELEISNIDQKIKNLFSSKIVMNYVVAVCQNNQVPLPYIVRFFSIFESPFFVPLNGRTFTNEFKDIKYPGTLTSFRHLLAFPDTNKKDEKEFKFDILLNTLKYIYPTTKQLDIFEQLYEPIGPNQHFEIPFPYFNRLVKMEKYIQDNYSLKLILSPDYTLSQKRNYNDYNFPNTLPDENSFVPIQKYEEIHGIKSEDYECKIADDEIYLNEGNFPCYGLFFDYKTDLNELLNSIKDCDCTSEKKVELFTSLINAFQVHPTWIYKSTLKNLKIVLDYMNSLPGPFSIEFLFVLYDSLKIPTIPNVLSQIADDEKINFYLKYNEGGYDLFYKVFESFKKKNHLITIKSFIEKLYNNSQIILLKEEYGKGTYTEEMLKDIILYTEELLDEISPSQNK